MLVTDYLLERAEKNPGKLAFEDEVRSITYLELAEESQKVACSIAALNISKKPVCIFLDKGIDCVCSMFATVFSGNFYTILDTQMPEVKRKKILEMLDPALIITDDMYYSDAKTMLDGKNDIPILLYKDALNKDIDKALLTTLRNGIENTDKMFVLFTSGSTGVPKGVIISHKAVWYYLDWLKNGLDIDESVVLASQSPLFFVLTVFDVYITVFAGGSCHFIPETLCAFPLRFLEFLKERKVNGFYFVPSLFCYIANLKALSKVHLDDLKFALFGGEVMPVKQLNMWIKEYPDVKFVNAYGSTEITDMISYYIVDRKFDEAESLPIGKSAPHMQTMILDEDRNVVKKGEIGELCVAGPSVADGYYKLPEKTNEVFLPNPLYKEGDGDDFKTIYCMGDLVKEAEDGNLLYIGRKDFQIKHRGYRIEPGEIETAASSLDGVELNCCIYNQKRERIEMFYTGDIEPDDLVAGLKDLLPEYMIPTGIRKLDSMPLNINGKIDKEILKSQI